MRPASVSIAIVALGCAAAALAKLGVAVRPEALKSFHSIKEVLELLVELFHSRMPALVRVVLPRGTRIAEVASTPEGTDLMSGAQSLLQDRTVPPFMRTGDVVSRDSPAAQVLNLIDEPGRLESGDVEPMSVGLESAATATRKTERAFLSHRLGGFLEDLQEGQADQGITGGLPPPGDVLGAGHQSGSAQLSEASFDRLRLIVICSIGTSFPSPLCNLKFTGWLY